MQKKKKTIANVEVVGVVDPVHTLGEQHASNDAAFFLERKWITSKQSPMGRLNNELLFPWQILRSEKECTTYEFWFGSNFLEELLLSISTPMMATYTHTRAPQQTTPVPVKKVEALTRPNAAMANFSTFRLLWNCASTAHAGRSEVHHWVLSQI
jgi:hypothetical protein